MSLRFAIPVAAGLLAGLAVPLGAGATDGVIEINQARVLAAGGFPFAIIASGRYRLTSNLTVAGTNGINVSADAVDIDLNGFSIIGPTACTSTLAVGGKLVGLVCMGAFSGTGINGAARVHDGFVRGFNVGVMAASGAEMELANVVLEQSNSGLVSGTARGVQVTDSLIMLNQLFGVNAQSATGSTVVRGSKFDRNAGVGVELAAGSVSGCTFVANLTAGVRVTSAARGAILENSYLEDNGTGFAANDLCAFRDNDFADNTASTSGGPRNLGGNACNGALCP